MTKRFWFFFWLDVLFGPYFIASAMNDYKHDEHGWAMFHGIIGWFVIAGLFRKLKLSETVKAIDRKIAAEKAGKKDAP